MKEHEKLREHRGVKLLAQGHTANKQWAPAFKFELNNSLHTVNTSITGRIESKRVSLMLRPLEIFKVGEMT